MYPSVKSVKATDDFRLILLFDNDEERIFDATAILSFGQFAKLSDIREFKKAHISFDTVAWDNGLDLDPEYLFEKSKAV